jgi:sirohydrochlorin cobaltochelatase
MDITMALILIAHGSRDPRWQQPFEQLLQRLKQAKPGAAIELAYMEFAEPTLLQVANACLLVRNR